MSSTNAHSVDIAVVSVPAVKKSYKSKALFKKICFVNQTFYKHSNIFCIDVEFVLVSHNDFSRYNFI